MFLISMYFSFVFRPIEFKSSDIREKPEYQEMLRKKLAEEKKKEENKAMVRSRGAGSGQNMSSVRSRGLGGAASRGSDRGPSGGGGVVRGGSGALGARPKTGPGGVRGRGKVGGGSPVSAGARPAGRGGRGGGGGVAVRSGAGGGQGGGDRGGYTVLEAVRLADEEAERQRRWKTEGLPVNPADRPVHYKGELVSRREVGRRKLWEQVSAACWWHETVDRYYDYCDGEEGRGRKVLSYPEWLEVAKRTDKNWGEYRLRRRWQRWEVRAVAGEVRAEKEVVEKSGAGGGAIKVDRDKSYIANKGCTNMRGGKEGSGAEADVVRVDKDKSYTAVGGSGAGREVEEGSPAETKPVKVDKGKSYKEGSGAEADVIKVDKDKRYSTISGGGAEREVEKGPLAEAKPVKIDKGKSYTTDSGGGDGAGGAALGGAGAMVGGNAAVAGGGPVAIQAVPPASLPYLEANHPVSNQIRPHFNFCVFIIS